jgi:hypothetical protein
MRIYALECVIKGEWWPEEVDGGQRVILVEATKSQVNDDAAQNDEEADKQGNATALEKDGYQEADGNLNVACVVWGI